MFRSWLRFWCVASTIASSCPSSATILWSLAVKSPRILQRISTASFLLPLLMSHLTCFSIELCGLDGALATYLGDSGKKGSATSTRISGITIQASGKRQRNSTFELRMPKFIQYAMMMPT